MDADTKSAPELKATGADLVHPAMRAIEKVEKCWTSPEKAAERARVLTCELINLGLLQGAVKSGIPLKAP